MWFKLKKIKILVVLVLVVSVFSTSTMTIQQKEANAFGFCIPCGLCNPVDLILTAIILELIQSLIFDPLIDDRIDARMDEHEEWIVEDFFRNFWVRGLAEMTEFLGAFGIYQTQMVGAFFDAKNQIETTRLYFKLHAEAHKDYHPSDDFCWFGTNARSLASSESRAKLNELALSQRSLQRQAGYLNTPAGSSVEEDKESRWNKFVSTYCDEKDNNWTGAGTGLDLACTYGGGVGAYDRRRVNKDVDYTRTIDEPRTLDINFSDNNIREGEEDVLALASNLYANNVLTRSVTMEMMRDDEGARYLWQNLRTVIAKRSVAESVFNAIVSMKSSGTGSTSSAALPDTGSYMAALIRELMPASADDAEIMAVLGQNPSYYAQLEFLGKRIYQSPDFYANLYDKPANVKRKNVAMKAIELMLDRALLESELRQEMVLSVLLSSRLNKQRRTINRDLTGE